MFLFQLPAHVPFPSTAVQNSSSLGTSQITKITPSVVTTTAKKTLIEPAQNPRLSVPFEGQGRIGKLLIYNTGKVVLLCGDIPLIIQQGTECSFPQEVAVVSPEISSNAQSLSFFEISKTMVCIPEWSQLFTNQK